MNTLRNAKIQIEADEYSAFIRLAQATGMKLQSYLGLLIKNELRRHGFEVIEQPPCVVPERAPATPAAGDAPQPGIGGDGGFYFGLISKED